MLETAVCVDLVRFSLQQPAHGLRLNKELLALLRLEGGHAVRKHPVIFDVFEVLAEQELCRLRVLLGLYVVELEAQLVVLEHLVLQHVLFVLDRLAVGLYQVGRGVVLRHKVILFHQ